MSNRRQAGFSLVEMVIAIALLGGVLAAMLMALNQSVSRSADPMLRLQLLALAQNFIDEAAARPYAAVANAAASPACSRAQFNDVRDYDGYASSGAVCAVDGSPIPALDGYSVRISVKPGVLSGVSAALRIVVTVSRGNESLQLIGWRTDYAS